MGEPLKRIVRFLSLTEGIRNIPVDRAPAEGQCSAFLNVLRSILPHMNSEFEWDPVKAASNQRKHSVSFEREKYESGAE